MSRPSTRWVRERRPAKPGIEDPFAPLGWFWETERTLSGTGIAALTVLLAGAECPFTCVYCDLWRHTLDGPTPRGALSAQLRAVLAGLGGIGGIGGLPQPCAIKLYNASNFFEPRAVPVEDEAELVPLLDPFARVTVECHPRLVGRRCLELARQLRGRLEVAMGLETVHREALARLNKGMSVDDFDRAAALLAGAGIGVRAFVLVGTPFVPREAAVEWAVRSAAHALARGAERVSLIPVREGKGALEALRERGDFIRPTLEQLEEALERCLDLPGGPEGIVAADLWDAERFATCPACAEGRLARLARMNQTGEREPRAGCDRCGWS
jgi:archaeosine synthase beta-subunit